MEKITPAGVYSSQDAITSNDERDPTAALFAFSKVRNKRSRTHQGPPHKNDKVTKRKMEGGPPRNALGGGTIKVKF